MSETRGPEPTREDREMANEWLGQALTMVNVDEKLCQLLARARAAGAAEERERGAGLYAAAERAFRLLDGRPGQDDIAEARRLLSSAAWDRASAPSGTGTRTEGE